MFRNYERVGAKLSQRDDHCEVCSVSLTADNLDLAAVPFGQTDPLFGKDVAFYLFSLPIYTLGLGLIRILILLSLIICTAVYVLRGSLSLSALFGKFGFDRLIEKLGSPLAKLVKIKLPD